MPLKLPDLRDVLAGLGLVMAGTGLYMLVPLGLFLLLVGSALVAAALHRRVP
jgi:hypothetical protein